MFSVTRTLAVVAVALCWTAGAALAAEATGDGPEVWVAVKAKAGADGGPEALRAFDSALRQKAGLPKSLRCVGCDRLSAKAQGQSPPALVYSFADGDQAGDTLAAFTAAWQDLRQLREQVLLEIDGPSSCSNYPQPPTCYTKAICKSPAYPGYQTPGCSRSLTSCQACL